VALLSKFTSRRDGDKRITKTSGHNSKHGIDIPPECRPMLFRDGECSVLLKELYPASGTPDWSCREQEYVTGRLRTNGGM
jgi:hypothetical protein